MANREDIIAKIRALRARAADQASSEAEVEAAARHAAKIIAENEVTESELAERGTDGIEEGEHDKGRRAPHPAVHVAAFSIGALCECYAMHRGGSSIWAGQPEDVQFALYLAEMIKGASERAYKMHWSKGRLNAPSAHYRKSFLMGFGAGAARRILQIAAERDSQRQATAGPTGTGLVVLKAAIVESYIAENYPAIKARKTRKGKPPNTRAVVAGLIAGERVNVARPLEQDDARSSVSQGAA